MPPLASIGFHGFRLIRALGICSACALPLSKDLLRRGHPGDLPAPFAQLARKLALPQTASLALRAPLPLPADIEGDLTDFLKATGAKRMLSL